MRTTITIGSLVDDAEDILREWLHNNEAFPQYGYFLTDPRKEIQVTCSTLDVGRHLQILELKVEIKQLEPKGNPTMTRQERDQRYDDFVARLSRFLRTLGR